MLDTFVLFRYFALRRHNCKEDTHDLRGKLNRCNTNPKQLNMNRRKYALFHSHYVYEVYSIHT